MKPENMLPKLWIYIKFLPIIFLVLPKTVESNECTHNSSICAAQNSIFAISGFDPIASATRIGSQTLITSRHAVADRKSVNLHIHGERPILANVIPSDFPGDIILLRAPSLPKGPIIPFGNAKVKGKVRVVAIDLKKRKVKIYKPGFISFLPSPGQLTSRLHHTAYSQPGNSGGALINNKGELIGIVASGGEGRFESIPVAQIKLLKERSGEDYRMASMVIGKSIRKCTLTLEDINYNNFRKINKNKAEIIEKYCFDSKNRQLYDLAASTLGRFGYFAKSIDLYKKSILKDQNAINSRIGLVVSLSLSKQFKPAIPHLRWLLERNVTDVQVLRLGIQTGIWAGDKPLAMHAFSILEKTNPKLAPIAAKFLKKALKNPDK